jgi:hypothetical protein
MFDCPEKMNTKTGSAASARGVAASAKHAAVEREIINLRAMPFTISNRFGFHYDGARASDEISA